MNRLFRADPVRIPVLLTLLVILGAGLSVIGKLNQIILLPQVGIALMLGASVLLTLAAIVLAFC